MKININPARIARRHGLGEDGEAQRYMVETVARMCDPYVPMESGNLKNSVQTNTTQIIYPGPYAHYQYHGEVMAGRAPKHYTGKPINYHGGPLRGKEWDKRMWADRGEEIVDGVARIVGGKRK